MIALLALFGVGLVLLRYAREGSVWGEIGAVLMLITVLTVPVGYALGLMGLTNPP